MTITRVFAMQLWQSQYGNAAYAEDFDGGLMYRDAYGDPEYYEWRGGVKVYCGWNIHHIQPLARGGKNRRDNMICTNIITNQLSLCSMALPWSLSKRQSGFARRIAWETW